MLEGDAEAQEDCAAPATQVIMETMERHPVVHTPNYPTVAPLPVHVLGLCPRAWEPLVPGCELGSGQPAVRSGLTLGRGTRLKVPLSFHL